MFVYLRLDKTVKRLTNVTLQHCYKPCVSTFTEERVEPALWYKVLVLDSILVDCELRTVYINYEKHHESDILHSCLPEELSTKQVVDFFRKREQIFKDSGCYDFDPTVDELFDTAGQIFYNLDPEVIDKEGNNATYEELLKMLHVFILPEIKFQTKERHCISDVLQTIEEQHEYIEDLIQKKDKTKRNTENSLSKQRQSLLLTENFSSARYVSSLDDTFLSIFLQHLEKDIRQLNEVLLASDRQVGSLRNSVSKKDISKLESARAESNEINSALERAIIAREEIKNVISRKHVRKKFKKNRDSTADFHELYVEVTKRLDKVNSEIRELIISKIKLSSVREAALLTLKEIDSDGVSYGYNRKKGSFEIETDLFDPSHKPEEWATLTERVKTYMHVKQAGFRSGYEKFCSQIKLKCQHLFDESKMFGISQEQRGSPVSPTTAQFINTIGNEAVSRRSKVTSNTDYTAIKVKSATMERRPRGYSTRWSIGCVPKHECEAICKEVTNHISDVAYDLAVEMKGSSEILKSFHSKLYVCYEEHVSSELMPILSELYEQSYRDQCETLAMWLARYSCDITFMQKTLTSLFDGSPDSSEEDSREVSLDLEETEVKVPLGSSKTDTIGSLSLKNLSLNELYDKFNKQSEDMPQSFVGALDMDYDGFLVIEGADDKHEDVFQNENHQDNSHVVNGTEGCYKASCDVKLGENESELGETDLNGEASGNSQVRSTQENMILGLPTYSEVILREKQSNTPPPYSSFLSQKDRFYKEFEQFFTLVHEEDSACTLFGKLRQMTRINKYVENQITRLRSEHSKNSITCTDDILDVIILLLCKLESPWLLKLYAHLNLTIHLSPPFMQGNAHDYSLVNISVAYQHLFEQQVLHKSAAPIPNV
ncbi:uncharacterized protein LOC123558694 [Mercenaria mercenaria]|uniref:uncharacterized protein LOC123558694 n=1 Tax=Mercenaria mercenaria TaxID=6596 RepID=UPI00234FB40D|nr:uncharacterized protein LOC123558694 [Mercenaria mercenaria]